MTLSLNEVGVFTWSWYGLGTEKVFSFEGTDCCVVDKKWVICCLVDGYISGLIADGKAGEA